MFKQESQVGRGTAWGQFTSPSPPVPRTIVDCEGTMVVNMSNFLFFTPSNSLNSQTTTEPNSFHEFWDIVLVSKSTEVFTCSFWMGAFDGQTPKRHRLWSNDMSLLESISSIGGSMSRKAMQQLPGAPLVKKYIDKSGKQRRMGIPERLKQSQFLGWKKQPVCSKVFGFKRTQHVNWSMCTLYSRLSFLGELRAYTAKFADLLAKHARTPLKVAWKNMAIGMINWIWKFFI